MLETEVSLRLCQWNWFNCTFIVHRVEVTPILVIASHSYHNECLRFKSMTGLYRPTMVTSDELIPTIFHATFHLLVYLTSRFGRSTQPEKLCSNTNNTHRLNARQHIQWQ